MTDIGVLAQKPFVFVVESFHKKGTLKDMIYKVFKLTNCDVLSEKRQSILSVIHILAEICFI